jgi:hypothetical protein
MSDKSTETMGGYSESPRSIPTEQLTEIAVKVAQEVLAGFPRRTARDGTESKLLPGNKLTLSLFSELRYGLGTPEIAGTAPKQQLSSVVTKDDAGKYKITYNEPDLPHDATKYQLVYADGVSTAAANIPAAVGEKVTIELPPAANARDANTLLAVKLADATEVILISFVTHA